MSSGFVSAGTGEDPVRSNDDWEKAKRDIDDNRRRREEAAHQESGKSLYETLQANKGKTTSSFSSNRWIAPG